MIDPEVRDLLRSNSDAVLRLVILGKSRPIGFSLATESAFDLVEAVWLMKVNGIGSAIQKTAVDPTLAFAQFAQRSMTPFCSIFGQIFRVEISLLTGSNRPAAYTESRSLDE